MFPYAVNLSYLRPPLECKCPGREILSVLLTTVSLSFFTRRELGIYRNTTKTKKEKWLRPMHTNSIGEPIYPLAIGISLVPDECVSQVGRSLE